MELRTLSEEDYVEAIKEGEIVRVPESVARDEDLFILRKLVKMDTRILSEKSTKKSESAVVKSYSRLEEWRSAKGNLKKNNVIKDLVQNFHWEVSHNRKIKGISRRQLAERTGVTEEEIKVVEMGDLPRDDFVLISKIENVLGINLRRESMSKSVSLAELQKMSESKMRDEIEKAHNKKENKTEVSGSDIELLDFE